MQELRRNVINLKSLDQFIPDTIVVGAGDANGRTLSVILTQEAAARFTPSTRLYLSWKHNDTLVEGLDVFKKVQNEPAIWEIKFPQEMLDEGSVLACLKVIDEISIDCSTNFLINILSDPNSSKVLEDSPNYTLFKQAALNLNNLQEQGEEQLKTQQQKFEETLAWVFELEEKLQNIIDERIGVLPDDTKNYIEYIIKVQEEQDRNFEETIEETKKELEQSSQEYTDNALKLIEY